MVTMLLYTWSKGANIEGQLGVIHHYHKSTESTLGGGGNTVVYFNNVGLTIAPNFHSIKFS